jgi:hypothetical protein
MSLVRGLIQPGLSAAKKAPFYSAVDEALAAIKRPKGTGAEFYIELTKQPGVKKAELADRKLEQAFKAKGKITKEEAQQILKDNPPPQVGERHLTEISDTERDNLLRDKIETSGYNSWDEVPSRVIRKWNEEIDEDLEKYGDYRTAGGQNYREILLKLPKSFTDSDANRLMYLQANFRRGELPTNELEELIALENKKQNTSPTYWSTHFLQDPNVLAHMRVQDRKGPNGEKILHVEEIQSDWHQEGRKKGYQVSQEDYANQKKQIEDKLNLLEPQLKAIGQSIYDFKLGNGSSMDDYRNLHSKSSELQRQRDELFDQSHKLDKQTKLGTPDAPFKKNWHELAMKRLLNYAAENGYDSIAITPGAEQARRYDLSKQVDDLQVYRSPDGTFDIKATLMRDASTQNVGNKIAPEQLSDYVGQSLAEKLLQQGANTKKFYSGEDLSVGGEGMKGFYDKMLPDYLNTFGKPYGAQVGIYDIDIPKMINVGSGAQTEVGRQQIPLHNFPITPEMRESIKQKGLPLYQQVGIPTVGTGAASQMVEQEAPEQEEPEYSKGGSIAKQAALAKLKQMRGEMAPRAEAVKSLIARDQNRYLADVVPNSLTNAEIESEIKRMAAKAPMIMKPSALTELRKIVQQEKGDYGSRRLERAADEIPNLEKLYTLDALKERFLGDNAKALMTMSPADFEKFATELQGKTSVGPKAAESAKQGEITKYTVPTNEYVKHLERIAMFDSVPYLNLAKEEVGLPLLPYISGHEGRHRSRALAGRGEKSNLVGITPTMDLREGLPRRSQEEFIEAMKKELELSGGLVLPQSEPMLGGRPPIILPDVYAKGGAVKPKVKDSKSGKVRITNSRDTMFMELSNKKLKRK